MFGGGPAEQGDPVHMLGAPPNHIPDDVLGHPFARGVL